MGGGGHNGARLVEGCYLQRPPPKFTELLLSTTSVKIGSLPSQGPATVLAGAFALQSTQRATRVSELTFAGAALGATCSRARKLLPEFLQISFWLPRPKLRRPFSPNSLHCVLMMIQLVVHNARCRVVLKRRSKKPMMRLPSFVLLARVSEERYSSELIFRFSKTQNIQLHISGKRTTNHEFVPWKLLSYVLFYQLAFMNLSTCYIQGVFFHWASP